MLGLSGTFRNRIFRQPLRVDDTFSLETRLVFSTACAAKKSISERIVSVTQTQGVVSMPTAICTTQ